MPATRTRPAATSAGESAAATSLNISRPLPLQPRSVLSNSSSSTITESNSKSSRSRRSLLLVPGGRTSLTSLSSGEAENIRDPVLVENAKALERARRAAERDRRQNERQRYLAEKESVQQREAERYRLNLLRVEKERQAAERERVAAEAAHHSALRHARQIYSGISVGLDWGFIGPAEGRMSSVEWTSDGIQTRAVRFPADTIVISRSEAKKMYSLTDAELSSLPYELKQNALLFAFSDKYKVYFALNDVKGCIRRRSAGVTVSAPSSLNRHRPPPLVLAPPPVIAVATQRPLPETPAPRNAFKKSHQRKVSFELTRPPTRE